MATASAPANVDEFVDAVVELAKEVLLESKALADVVTAEDGEEKFPEFARQAATATSKLIEMVNTATFAPPTMQDELLQATREARDCLLELCRATKAAIANPYDFLTTQKLQNCRKGIAVAVKAVLDIAETLREAPLDSVEKILEEAKNSVQAIGRMVVAARGQNQDTFVETAKSAAASMSKLIEAAKSRLPQQQEALFASTQAIIKAAKLTFKENSKPNQDALELAMRQVAEDIKNFVNALSASQANQAAALAAVSAVTAPPPVRVQPIDANDLSRSLSPRRSVEPTTTPISPKVQPVSSSNSLSPSPAPHSSGTPAISVSAPQTAPGPSQTYSHVIDIMKLALGESRGFREDWHGQNSTAQEAFIKRLENIERNIALVPLKEKIAMLKTMFPPPPASGSGAGTRDEGRSHGDLELMKQLSLGMSFKKRFATVTKDMLHRQEDLPNIPKENVVNQLMDLANTLGDLTLKFILRLFQTSDEAAGSGQPDVEVLCREFLDCLKKIVVVARASLNVTQHAAVEKLLSGHLATLESTSTRGQMDEGVRAVATTMLAQLVATNMKKKLWREANALRVLVVHMLATVHAASANRNSLHHLTALSCGTIAKVLADGTTRVLSAHETSKYMEANRKQNASLSDIEPAVHDDQHSGKVDAKLKALAEDMSTQKERNIWEEGEIPSKELQKGVSTGSLNKLVLFLSAEGAYDNKLLKTFITTYRSFASPYRLWQKLLERYNVPKNAAVDMKKIQVRVTVIINYWVQNNFTDFDESLVAQLFEYVEKTLPRDNLNDIAAMLRKTLKSQLEARNELNLSSPPTDLTIPEAKISPAEFFIALNDEEIARQLTHIEFSCYRQIEPSELLNQSWNKDKLKYRAPNVIESLARLNRLSFWVPSTILMQERMKDRAKVYTKFAKIAEHLRRMNNYHTLMGIIAGLNMGCVNRLKHTLNAVGPELQKSFKELVQLMHPSSSYRKYREALRKSSVPAIPFLGTYLQDLTFIEDGNPDFINGEINFKKRELVYQSLQDIQLYQSKPYDFPVVEPISTFLTDLPYMGEKELHELSNMLEPRDCELNQIVQ